MHNVMVSGGAGFVGSNFVHYLLQAEPEVHILNLDALTYAGSLENLADLPEQDRTRHTFVRGDICDGSLVGQLLRKYRIDTIVHFAAESHVDRSILAPPQFVRTNVSGTLSLLDAARSFWLDENSLPIDSVRFHHVSTDEVFGSLAPEEPAWTEDAPYAPNSPYAATKAASDHLVRAYGHTYHLPYTLTHSSNNYGPRQFPEKLIALVILSALDGRPLPVYGDGRQIRDWLHVQDHCEAIHLVLKKASSGSSYNIGGENQTANLTVVETLCDLLDELSPDSLYRPHRRLIEFVNDRPGHDRRYALNIERIRAELGWHPRHTLAEGLAETVGWYLSHPDWIATIRQRPEYQDWLKENYTSR